MLPPLQQAAPLAQHDAPAVAFPFFIIGHLSPAQHDAAPQHIFPSAIFPSGHFPSLQQLLSLPQHDFPSAIFPSFIMGHLSPAFMFAMSPQHAHVFAASPAAGAVGIAVCAIIASANTSMLTTTITFVFMISSLSRCAGKYCPPFTACDGTLPPPPRRSDAHSRF
jgi:hypothetical protein